MPLERKQLDTSSLQAKFPAKELPAHQQFGKGERYSFGTTHVDIYPLPPSANLGHGGSCSEAGEQRQK